MHLDLEISREEYERLIRQLVESTLDSVHRALVDAGKRPDDVDEILLVGGATRTPLVPELLREKTGLVPRQEVHPDLCVALGAGILAARLAGRDIDRVLVDISPYSFGPSYLGLYDGRPYEHCYHPIIARNTPLPASRTDRYSTVVDNQEVCEVAIYQGDDPNALNNILVGRFKIENLSAVPAGNEILCRMDLDLDGIGAEPVRGEFLLHGVCIRRVVIAADPELLARTLDEIEQTHAGLPHCVTVDRCRQERPALRQTQEGIAVLPGTHRQGRCVHAPHP